MSSICSSRLLSLRRRFGLSQKEVAAYLGISPQCCSHYESGRRVPDIFMLYRFAQQYLHFLAYQKQHPSPIPPLPSSQCFAHRLKKYRKRLGLTQVEVARTLHITPAAYSHYETGQRLPSLELFQKIADLFQIPMEILLMSESDFPQTLPHRLALLSSEEQQEVRLFIDFLRTHK